MKRPRNAYHAPHPADSWGDDLPNHNAQIGSLSASEPERGDVLAKLWVPDIEMRHGWREVWVRRDVDPPEERRAGFR